MCSVACWTRLCLHLRVCACMCVHSCQRCRANADQTTTARIWSHDRLQCFPALWCGKSHLWPLLSRSPVIFSVRNRNLNHLQKNAPHQILKPTMQYKLSNSFHYSFICLNQYSYKTYTNMHYTYTHTFCERKRLWKHQYLRSFSNVLKHRGCSYNHEHIHTFTQKHMK